MNRNDDHVPSLVPPKRGGPRTKRGRVRSAGNALTHGLTALSVPTGERAAYREHLAAVTDALGPVGVLEERLAERVGLNLWRLRRLSLWEAGKIEDAQQAAALRLRLAEPEDHRGGADAVDTPLGLALAAVRREVRDLTGEAPHLYLRDLDAMEAYGQRVEADGEALLALPADFTVDVFARLSDGAFAEIAWALVDAMREMGVSADDIAFRVGAAADTPDDWEPLNLDAAWLAVETETRTRSVPGPMQTMRRLGRALADKGRRLTALAGRVRAIVGREQMLSLVPAEGDLSKLMRYEAHLDRGLYRALHELEAVQAKRVGGEMPLMRVEVHGMSDLTNSDG